MMKTRMFNGKKYTANKSDFFDGRQRRSNAKKHAEFLRSVGCSTKIEHKEKQSIVWARCEKVT